MEDPNGNPSVTVIVPVRNGAQTIQPLLESLQKLDYDPSKVDVVVVDGNSKDKTREIVKKYPVKLVVENKQGINLARNIGIKNSNGEIIAFTDSDCIVPPNWVTKIVENFKDPQVSCVGGSAIALDNDFVSQYADNSIVRLMPVFTKREEFKQVKPFFGHPAGCNMAFRRKAVEKVGFFDEQIQYGFDEVEFADRICRAGYKMVLDPDVSVWHKHRSTFGEFLKQNFQYGKGSGLVFKKNLMKDSVSKWTFLAIIGFIAWLGIVGTFTFLTLTSSSSLFFWILFGFTGLPLIIVGSVYAFRSIKNKKFARIISYPFIDMFRTITFCSGQLYQIIKGTKNAKD
ncbi:MAG: glycosyltransferase [Candidatus Bathyarchaeota archaeon]|nr:glycosyltransferase [Candidatus Bathyarchaeum tardum]WGM89211.1 MAG: glycosyltransferase [Candidatus Bathyarchaeum tardum]WNZ28551.1 MAG: glycosyltransferase [Candidatus Bathyarchaeota archaeon]